MHKSKPPPLVADTLAPNTSIEATHFSAGSDRGSNTSEVGFSSTYPNHGSCRFSAPIIGGAATIAADSSATTPRATLQYAEECYSLHEQSLREAIKTHHTFVVIPDSALERNWDLAVAIISIYSLIKIPYDLAFATPRVDIVFAINVLCDLVFIMDIVFNFRRGYKTWYGIELNLKKIARRYAKTWFIVDLIPALPIDLIATLAFAEGADATAKLSAWGRASDAAKFLRLPRLFRLFRLFRLYRVVNWTIVPTLPGPVVRIVKFMSMILLFLHWDACFHYLVVVLSGFPPRNWVEVAGLLEENQWGLYTHALFQAFSHMLCIGYGSDSPRTLPEKWFSMLSMLVGATMYATLVGAIAAHFSANDSASARYSVTIDGISEYMRYRKLPQSLNRRIRSYFEHRYTRQKMFDDDRILSHLSNPLQMEVKHFLWARPLENISFLHGCSEVMLNSLMWKLRPGNSGPGDVIMYKDGIPTEMIFINSGQLSIIDESGNHLMRLGKGATVGEEGLLAMEFGMKYQSPFSVLSVEYCELMLLHKDDFYLLMNHYEDMGQVVRSNARARLQKLGILKKFGGSVLLTPAALECNETFVNPNNPTATNNSFGWAPGNSFVSPGRPYPMLQDPLSGGSRWSAGSAGSPLKQTKGVHFDLSDPQVQKQLQQQQLQMQQKQIQTETDPRTINNTTTGPESPMNFTSTRQQGSISPNVTTTLQSFHEEHPDGFTTTHRASQQQQGGQPLPTTTHKQNQMGFNHSTGHKPVLTDINIEIDCPQNPSSVDPPSGSPTTISPPSMSASGGGVHHDGTPPLLRGPTGEGHHEHDESLQISLPTSRRSSLNSTAYTATSSQLQRRGSSTANIMSSLLKAELQRIELQQKHSAMQAMLLQQQLKAVEEEDGGITTPTTTTAVTAPTMGLMGMPLVAADPNTALVPTTTTELQHLATPTHHQHDPDDDIATRNQVKKWRSGTNNNKSSSGYPSSGPTTQEEHSSYPPSEDGEPASGATQDTPPNLPADPSLDADPSLETAAGLSGN